MALDTATIIKGTLGVLGVSGLGVGGYYGIQALNKETIESIEKQLEKSNLRKLAKGNIEWTNIFTSYQTVSQKDATLKFTGNEITNKEELQTRCEEILSKDASEDNKTNNYLKKAKKWCVEPITVKALLNAQKISILSTTTQDANTTKAKWDKKVTAYRELTGNSKAFGELTLGAKSAQIDDAHRKSIKDKCDAAGQILNHKEEYEKNLKNFKDWCTDLN